MALPSAAGAVPSLASRFGSRGIASRWRNWMREQGEADAQRYGPHDVAFMRRALVLARNGLGLTSPNPMVGAVIVADGRVVGEGWHEGPGTPHAEINALRQARQHARHATLYVTLEPCTVHGRTPPCAPIVRDAGITRVVAGMRDPNPRVDGQGFDLMRGAEIEVVDGVLEAEAAALNPGFIKHWSSPLPFVILKMAASLDGKAAAIDGSSRWITGKAAREDVHRLRAGSGAVLVGAGTALADEPSLTVRLADYRGRQPLRVVVDGLGRVPPRGALFDDTAPTMVATTNRVSRQARRAWMDAGAEVLIAPEEPEREGRVGLRRLLEHLGEVCHVQDVLIEGGPTLAWSAMRAGVVDQLVLYLAPKLIGGESAPGVLGGDGVATMASALPVRITRIDRLGSDVKVTADVHRDH